VKFDPPLLRFIRVGFFNHLISNDPTAGLLHSPKKDFLSLFFLIYFSQTLIRVCVPLLLIGTCCNQPFVMRRERPLRVGILFGGKKEKRI
jgi:hypothetical protein